MKKKSKRFVAPLLAIVAILIVAAIWMLVTAQSKDINIPTEDASPEQVVAAYVSALDAHDCETAEALAIQPHRDTTAGWCRNVASMTDLEVSPPVPKDSSWSDPSGLRSSAAPRSDRDLVYVPVTFDLRWRILHMDRFMAEGSTHWGYLLERQSPTDPWRVFDEGHG